MLYQGKIGSRKHQSSIDAVARVMNRVEEAWRRVNSYALLLIDVKGAFDYVSRNCLSRRMTFLGADNDLVGWVESLLTDRRL